MYGSCKFIFFLSDFSSVWQQHFLLTSSWDFLSVKTLSGPLVKIQILNDRSHSSVVFLLCDAGWVSNAVILLYQNYINNAQNDRRFVKHFYSNPLPFNVYLLHCLFCQFEIKLLKTEISETWNKVKNEFKNFTHFILRRSDARSVSAILILEEEKQLFFSISRIIIRVSAIQELTEAFAISSTFHLHFYSSVVFVASASSFFA